MGVYIAGMKMPKNCEECQCSYWTEGVHHDYCQAVGYDTEIHHGEKDRAQWCPLIEVPEPHGRLIDADGLLMRINHEVMEAYMDGVCYGVHPNQEYLYLLGEIIDDAPTIIPASKEGKT